MYVEDWSQYKTVNNESFISGVNVSSMWIH